MNKNFRVLALGTLSFGTLAFGTLAIAAFSPLPAFAQVAPVVGVEPANDILFKQAHPNCGILRHGDQIARVFGHFASGNSPRESALGFINEQALSLYGVNPADLAPIGPFEGGEHLLQLMPDDFGNYTFTGVYFAQQVKGIPVYKAGLIVLTRNETGFPAVLASSTLWDVRDAESVADGVNVSKLPSAKLWTRNANAEFRAQPEFSPAQYVIWAGIDRVKAAPRLAVLVTGEAGGPAEPANHQRIEFVIDAKTGEILYQENKICNAVSGRVTGMATPGYTADTCVAEVSTGIPYAKVVTGGTTVYTDVDGNYSIPAGAAGATYTTTLVGRWFTTTNNGAATLSLSTTANDGANWSPVFNSANTAETERAQVNGYVMANKTRDMVVSASPNYPTVATQAGTFQVNCNLADVCNAYYTGNTINFFIAGSGCANSAFGDVVAHEYGHNVIAKGGSGQGAYGEGMSDIHAVLLSDSPQLGVGFQSCSVGDRTAQNTCQFSASQCATGSTAYGAPCGGGIHSCGQLISGCVWDLRNRLRTLYPSTYRTMLARLAVNSIPLHGAISTIANDITVDFLTLDDNDADINNGTPNYTAINDAFTVHGLGVPTITLLNFSFPNGQPGSASPTGSTALVVKIDPIAGTPNPSTAKLYVKAGSATTYTAYPMTSTGSNKYTAYFPAALCPSTTSYYVSVQTTSGLTATSPSDAPVTSYLVPVAASASTMSSDDFEGTGTWTSGAAGDNATTGQWVLGDPIASDAQPEDDHTPGLGVKCWFTGQGAVGGSVSAADVDGGVTTLVSPAFNCAGYSDVEVSYWRWYSNNKGTNPATNTFPIDVSGDNGVTWVNLETVSQAVGQTSEWVQKSFKLNGRVPLSAQVKFRFRASDYTGAAVEAAIDDFRLVGVNCQASRPADLNGDGVVNGTDLGRMLGGWGQPGPTDLNGDGVTNGTDMGLMLGDWG
jgi:hypothetical protein